MKPIKSIGFACVCLILLTGTGGGQRLPKTLAPITIVLQVLSPVIAPGARVDLQVTVKNVSERDFHYSHSGAYGTDISFLYFIQTAAGADVPRIALPRSGIGIGRSAPLRSGQSFTKQITSVGYDLTKPGRYRIRVGRQLPKELGGGTVYSNWASFTVEKPKTHQP